MGHTMSEVMNMAKKKSDGRNPKTPAVSDPPVPNRAWTEMKIDDPTPKGEHRDPKPKSEKTDP